MTIDYQYPGPPDLVVKTLIEQVIRMAGSSRDLAQEIRNKNVAILRYYIKKRYCTDVAQAKKTIKNLLRKR